MLWKVRESLIHLSVLLKKKHSNVVDDDNDDDLCLWFAIYYMYVGNYVVKENNKNN